MSRKLLVAMMTVLLLLLSCVAIAAQKTAIFAGGCFWCVQADLDKVPGVISTISGYDGGKQANPTYSLVSSGRTHYVESVKVVYDPQVISYQQLLSKFWRSIDPTDQNGQFCDKGEQYRSVIFYLNDRQRQIALQSKQAIAKQLGTTIYTDVIASTEFYPAEDYHQDYYKKHSLRYKFYRYHCGRDQRLEKVWGNVDGK